ncbi:MAG: DUF3791 domain-containing protein [Oscillospiraceae bacterium]|jgi:hypothetical protein|nr:DUF3791 domain-containing protein [Oscillospiraceae bacterium]
MSNIEIDKNTIVVAAIEGYSSKHNLPTRAVFNLFKKNKIIDYLRSQYEVLHTQSLDESVLFAEDVLARRT